MALVLVTVGKNLYDKDEEGDKETHQQEIEGTLQVVHAQSELLVFLHEKKVI